MPATWRTFVGHQDLVVEATASAALPFRGEIGVQRGDHLGALADGGGDPLDRSGAHVADGEHAGAVGFQRVTPLAAVIAGAHEALSHPARHRIARASPCSDRRR